MAVTVFEFAQEHLNNKLPFVLYRKPRESLVHGHFQNSTEVFKNDTPNVKGFVFAPFNSNEDQILLRSDLEMTGFFDLDINISASPETTILENALAKKKHEACINTALEHIQAGSIKKVVLSRKITVANKKTCLAIFNNILASYSTAFCYLWYHPTIGTWLGATPEILLKTSGLAFTTMSLAGTQTCKENDSTPTWSKKEVEEQQLVTAYIVAALDAKVEKLEVSETESVNAGHLWHLRTKITGSMNRTALNATIKALHPTPAVCGLPLAQAKTFIADHEGYSREFYTGFLGELNFEEEQTRNKNKKNQENSAYRTVKKRSELYVNLRCIQLIDDKAIIYVGGGITAASNPADEWQETEQKAKTMLRVLNN